VTARSDAFSEALDDWSADAPGVVSRTGAGRTAFSYLFGFRLNVLEAEMAEGVTRAEAGRIVRFEEDGSLLVAAGEGVVRIRRAWLDVAGDRVEDVGGFLETCRGEPPFVLRPVPFVDNASTNAWEQMVEIWRNRDVTEEGGEVVHGDWEAPAAPPPLVEANRVFFRALLDRLGLPAQGRFIDVGCADGWAPRIMRDLGWEVWGVDLLARSVGIARRLTRDGTFIQCDVFRLGEHEELKGRFDLVFCRDLGIAQKIVDWDDPSWVEAGRAICELMNRNGCLYWIQMTDGSGRLDVDGFSNATVDTLREWFGRFGEVVSVVAYGYMSLLVVPRPGASARRRAVEAYDDATARAVLEAPSPHARLIRALYSKLSRFLQFPRLVRRRGVVIVGTSGLAQMAASVADDLGVSVKAFATLSSGRGVFADRPVLPLQEALALGPCGVVFSGEGPHPAVDPALHRVALWEGAALDALREPFLISGDQDRYFDTVKAAGAPALQMPRWGEDALRDGGLDNSAAWKLGGGNRRPASPGEGPHRGVELEYGTATTYLVQRCNPKKGGEATLGCWIRADAPHVARVQLSDERGDSASSTHPGDGDWHFLSVTRPVGEGYLDAYLQLIDPGRATFADAILLLSS
jgi:SAM-dependent methyltransferase